ncbi:hypothetical protein [Pseudobacteriovorax antillogorgiicola]|uniref:F5/8 type C domain-containing protein n=1 Tax=Pseudobacteriovorax antillogorgiicola TaxID=1513793 RepID=A0A1Y6BYI9_9BACT|nr:hypothetical protein [Pseudobacteriovorax antillogorgiicola]TCS50186.1 hypothetical protein EDD56_1134 [Pseudobacteriovorax antillogorgiicola]SMF32110.1 hypothetical protein SAMN06296036_1103 [Pseudobacteriovorax antillogorgiicola]
MRWLTLFCICLIGSCESTSESESPQFDPSDIVEISGTYLNDDGSPAARTYIHLQNLNTYGYYDPLYTSVADFLLKFFQRVAFWPFPFYSWGDNDRDKTSPGYFLDEIRTNDVGQFNFEVTAGSFVRDSSGAINITLINDGDESSDPYGRFTFVIKEQVSALDELILCKLEPLTLSEGASTIDISWLAPSFTVESYQIKFANPDDNSPIWVSSVEGTETTISLPKSIFADYSVRFAIEAFYQIDGDNESQLKKSCLTPSQEFTIATPTPNLAANAYASSPSIDFTITSLSNGEFDDPWYFEAFDTNTLTIDLGSETTIESINLHNLMFSSSSSQTIAIQGASSGNESADFSELIATTSATRYMSLSLTSPATVRWLKIIASSTLLDLQEVSIQ